MAARYLDTMLSQNEKILVVEAIWDNIALENNQYQISNEEFQMLEERYEEYKANPGNVLSWEEVKKNILEKTGIIKENLSAG